MKASDPFIEETEGITVAKLAELAVLEERTTQRELKAMVTAKIVKVKQVSRGLYIMRPMFRTWARLPSYAPGPVVEPEAPQEEASTEEAPKAKEKVTTNVTRKPVHVSAGKKSKEYPVECGVSAVQFDVRKVDADCSAVVKDGVMCVTLEPKVEAPRAEAPQARKPEREYVCDHPRAQELCAIFDPLLWKSSHKTLSGDISCLQSACEAIGDTPHEILEKFVVGRSSRAISGGPAVVAICKEVGANARRAVSLPVEKKLPTHEELDAMVARDREARLAKEKELRKRRVS